MPTCPGPSRRGHSRKLDWHWSPRLVCTFAATNHSSTPTRPIACFLPTPRGADLIQSHVSIGFDRTAIQRDLNVVVPLDRLRELVEDGTIGGIGPNVYAFMGAQRPPYMALEENAAVVGRRLRDEGVEYVLDRNLTALLAHRGCAVASARKGLLVTVGVTLVREHTEKVKPPRALWVPYPYGRPLGKPGNAALQHQVIRAALDLYAAADGPSGGF